MQASRDKRDCASEVIARCQTLARFSEDTGSIRRTFLSPPMRECHREIAGWVAPLGVTSRVDAVGNLRIVYPAAQLDAPRLLIGSHLDTVPNAEEEGVRFGTPFIGSRALVSNLDEELLSRQDARGISIRDAIADFGLNPAEISQAAMHEDVLGYIEFHIEQGPVLENVNRPLGVVEAIAGQSRVEFTFVGQANHAGTTPMNLRHDALAAAAEWIGTVESHAQNTSGLVATVGAIQANPGAGNVIAGETRLSLDVRHRSDEERKRAVDYFVRQAEDIATRRGLKAKRNVLMDQLAVQMDPFLVKQVEHAIGQARCEPYRMVSGAGHDAMILAGKVPSAMIFLRTPGGISHHPAESVEVGDVEKAIECGVHLLEQLASSSEFQRKTKHA